MQQHSALEHRFRATRPWLAVLLVALACTMLIPALGHAARVTFRWDYTASGAAGFMLYCGPLDGKHTTVVDVGNTDTYTVDGLSPGDAYECAVTAYDAARVQSDYSDPLRIYIAVAGRCAGSCDADLNADGQVDALDLGVLKQQWGTSDPESDLNGDGVVNVRDLGIFRVLYQ
jgi:hypothetical protein